MQALKACIFITRHGRYVRRAFPTAQHHGQPMLITKTNWPTKQYPNSSMQSSHLMLTCIKSTFTTHSHLGIVQAVHTARNIGHWVRMYIVMSSLVNSGCACEDKHCMAGVHIIYLLQQPRHQQSLALASIGNDFLQRAENACNQQHNTTQQYDVVQQPQRKTTVKQANLKHATRNDNLYGGSHKTSFVHDSDWRSDSQPT
jgi:hypothetical protein